MKLEWNQLASRPREGELSWKAGMIRGPQAGHAWLNLPLDYGQFGRQNVKEENKHYDFRL